MRALTFGGRRSVTCESVPDPGIEAPTDAIVRVRLAGVCGSDLHVYHERERGLDHGTVMGHELIGDVVETGAGVRRVRRGDDVLSPFTTSCGSCPACVEGLTARCERGQLFGWVENGEGLQGAQGEYVRVPLADSTLVPIPDGCTDEIALLLGDVLSTGHYCALRADVRAGGRYVVLGCGPVGLMAVASARDLGAERIWAFDTVPERLDLARRFGAQPIHLADGDAVEGIREATEGRGPDAVLEAVGSAEAGRLAVELVRPGGTVSIVGVHNEPSFAFSPADAYDKNVTLRIGRCPARQVLESLIRAGGLENDDRAAVISHTLALEDGARAYRIFDKKQEGCTKVVLRL